MKTLQLICAAFALALVAAPAPAQVAIEARLGKSIRVGVVAPARGPVHDNRHDHRHDDRRGNHRGHHDGGHRNHGHAPRVTGHWKVVYEDVHVPGYWREDHVPARYGWIYDHCGRRWGIVDAGGCRRVWVPARCETRSRRVWVPC